MPALRSDEEVKSRQPLVAPSSQKAEASNTPSNKDRVSGARTRGKLKNEVAEAKNEVADAKKKLAKQEEEICELKNQVKSLTAILLRATEKRSCGSPCRP
jgi:predicted  nucleic acid-binding Zn-ribbon protein